MTGVRESFDQRLDSLRGQLVMMASSAASAIQLASRCLFSADLLAAGQVLDLASDIGESRRSLESQTFDLLATQQPVASDLRLAWASIQVGGDLERMGVLAAHIAKIMIRRHPTPAVAPSLAKVVPVMGQIAERQAWRLARVLEIGDPRLSAEIISADDEMDALERRLFEVVLTDWSFGVAAAIDATQMGRFYERFADHAVTAARHVDFLITGVLGDARKGDRTKE
jgi:phosphate transport system protein